MSTRPLPVRHPPEDWRLVPFDERHAARVASWVRDSREAYWLAPRTAPPLTAEEVRSWRLSSGESLLLVSPADLEPAAYGELNPLNERRGDYWLGHLIVDPARRGRGLGRRLTALLLERAFGQLGAQRVTLVVFPQNASAIACYQAAGMHEAGYELHHFAPYQRCERLLRLVAERR